MRWKWARKLGKPTKCYKACSPISTNTVSVYDRPFPSHNGKNLPKHEINSPHRGAKVWKRSLVWNIPKHISPTVRKVIRYHWRKNSSKAGNTTFHCGVTDRAIEKKSGLFAHSGSHQQRNKEIVGKVTSSIIIIQGWWTLVVITFNQNINVP